MKDELLKALYTYLNSDNISESDKDIVYKCMQIVTGVKENEELAG